MDIRLPKLGEGSESGTAVNVLVKVGDSVKKDQTIIELENEKAVAPIPSTAAGVVSVVHVKAGDKVAVGQKLITLSGTGETAAALAETKPATAASLRPAALVAAAANAVVDDYVYHSPSGQPPPASPSVRKAARELAIDLTRVRGTESGGRISMGDLRNYVQRLQQLAASGGAHSQAAAPAVLTAVDFSQWGKVSKKPVTSLRKAISKQMSLSWTRVPRVTQFDEADITDLMLLKKKYDAAYEKKGAKLTLTSFALVAVAELLKQNPIFNASLDEAAGELVFKEYYHIGIAVDTEQGLIVPVLRDVNKKNMVQLSKELHDLADRTRSRKVALDELKGGTFSISNQGGIGGSFFTPIVNIPEVAILGIGKGVLKPAVKGKEITPRLMLPLSLAYDHRIIDGGQAARFIRDLSQAFEQFPESKVKI